MKDAAIHDAAERWVQLGDAEAMRLLGAALRDPRSAATVVRALHFEQTLRTAIAAREIRRRSSIASQRVRRTSGSGRAIRLLAIAAGLVIATILALTLLPNGRAAPRFAELVDADGPVALGDGSALTAGSDLPAGSEIVLTRGRATVRLIDGDAVCALEAGASPARFTVSPSPHLQRGAVHVRAGKRAAEQALTFTTPHATATVVGTVFRLDVEDDTRLQVEEGRVAFARRGMAGDIVAAGRSTTVGRTPSAAPAQPMPKPVIAYEFAADARLADRYGGLDLSVRDAPAQFGMAGLRLSPGSGAVAIGPRQGEQAWQACRDGGGISLVVDLRFDDGLPTERILLAEILGFLDPDSTRRIAPLQLWFKPGPHAAAGRTQRWAISVDGGVSRTWCDGTLVEQGATTWSLATTYPPIHVKLMHIPAAATCPAAWFARMLVLPASVGSAGAAYLRADATTP